MISIAFTTWTVASQPGSSPSPLAAGYAPVGTIDGDTLFARLVNGPTPTVYIMSTGPGRERCHGSGSATPGTLLCQSTMRGTTAFVFVVAREVDRVELTTDGGPVTLVGMGYAPGPRLAFGTVRGTTAPKVTSVRFYGQDGKQLPASPPHP